jgi:Protein of unknown function (DUF2934)
MASAISEEKVRTRAYELWLEAGSPEGRDEEFWQQAQSQVSAPTAPTQEDAIADSDEFAGARPEDKPKSNRKRR